MQVSIGEIVFGAFVTTTLIQLFYYLGIFSRFAFRKAKTELATNHQEPVSVVICAKNEAQNLQKNIPLFFAQNYPSFQIVVVNDCSVDESEDILDEFEKKYPSLHVVTLKEDEIREHDKKLALTLGIKGAKHDLLLLTDADCVPANADWIATMVRSFDATTDIVLGFGAFKKSDGFLNKLIRFDGFFVALQYLSYSLSKLTYMGVGRNLAYRKSLFFKHKGFAAHYHIQSGDDDLFINGAATKNNTKIEFSSNSFTYSEPKKTFRNWVYQKKRHITTAKYYRAIHKFLLSLFSATTFLFYCLFVALLVLQFELYLVLSVFVVRMLVQMIIFRKSMVKLGQNDLWWFSFGYEILLMLFYPFIFVSNIFVKKHKWK
jgi:glycosyltransferase involved in cell wall biosynthesis